MADKKSIVIKVKYPAAGKMPENKTASAKTVSEWNVKKIAIALCSLVFVLASLFFLVGSNEQPTEPEKPTAETAEITAAAPVSKATKTQANNRVLRALLTTKVVNNEPVDEITLPLKISKKGSTWIYYFVELNSMKGKTIYHEWLLDGVLISRKKVNISNETWRTSSRQVFRYTSDNNWTVRLVDENGEIIDEKHFNVIYQ